MKKIKFADVLPHIVAAGVFWLVTIFLFSPIFFENKVLNQHDIQQGEGQGKARADFIKQTGEEPLWMESLYAGMPAHIGSISWHNVPLHYVKRVASFGMTGTVSSIFMCFVCYYIMLLAFGVRPYLAIAGAIAFGLSSYMIIGAVAGHNARIGSIAFIPLVVAGIHLAFTKRSLLGFTLTATGLSLNLIENHVQITYYLLLIVLGYGLMQLIIAIREKTFGHFFKTLGLLVGAVILATATFFGQLWAIIEYGKYSTRGPSELASANPVTKGEKNDGLDKDYAFQYSNGILEPFTLLIPNFYGGGTSDYLVLNRDSETRKALSRSGNEQMANQLAPYTSAYWGKQPATAPYYAGAIIVFLFVLGLLFAERKYVWWLGILSAIALMLTWGDNFKAFNYFIFDYLPGYNKFRSVTFTIVIVLFAMPLLGMMGLEKLLQQGVTKPAKKKILVAFAVTGGLCLFFWLFAGMFSFTREGEEQLPPWFLDAMIDDRMSLFRSDAFRSLAFVAAAFIVIYFDVHKKISPMGFYAFLIFMIMIDLLVVDKRYLTKDSYRRKSDQSYFAMTEADQLILQDKSHYRVYNLQNLTETRTSYYHKSIGGYHAAKIRRYQDFIDSCLVKKTNEFITQAQQQRLDMTTMGAFNMLNVKYLFYGPKRDQVIPNPEANGNAWFVKTVEKANSPAEELAKTCDINTKNTAVIDASKFAIPTVGYDSAATIALEQHTPKYLQYASNSKTDGLVVFSEVYYPEGWIAKIDGRETQILRANYILRALPVPAGQHKIEFSFEPKPYLIGDKITNASSWVVVLLLIGGIGWNLREKKKD